jgi:hypothetical protein
MNTSGISRFAFSPGIIPETLFIMGKRMAKGFKDG